MIITYVIIFCHKVSSEGRHLHRGSNSAGAF